MKIQAHLLFLYIINWQESACFQEYHDALKLQRDGDLNGAKVLYQHLLQSTFLSVEVMFHCTPYWATFFAFTDMYRKAVGEVH